MKWRDCTIYVAKTKALLSCSGTAQLIWAFVFAYAKSRFSHDTAQLTPMLLGMHFCTSYVIKNACVLLLIHHLVNIMFITAMSLVLFV